MVLQSCYLTDTVVVMMTYEPTSLIDGYGLIKKIRVRDAKLPKQIPAIALTAYAGDEDKIRSIEAGFDLHLVKPTPLKLLVDSILSLLHKNSGSNQATKI